MKSKRKSRPVKTKEDVTSQWQKLCALNDSSSTSRDSSKGSSSKSAKTASRKHRQNSHDKGKRPKPQADREKSRERRKSSASPSERSSSSESECSLASDGASRSESEPDKRRCESKRNGSASLPKFLRRTMAHSTDPPMELSLDPEMAKKHKSGSAKVASALLTAMTANQPNVDAKLELSNSKFHSFAVFAMRGFGEFDHSLGMGVYSDQLEDALIRAANGRRELMLNRGWRFPLTSRLAKGATKLTIGAYSSKDISESSIMLSDFYRHSMEFLESCTHVKGKYGARKPAPDTTALFRETVKNQLLFTRDVFCSQHVGEREKALDFLRTLAEEQPELFPPSFLNDCWDRVNADYCDAIFEGSRCIMQVLDVTANRMDFWRVASTPRSAAEGGGGSMEVP